MTIQRSLLIVVFVACLLSEGRGPLNGSTAAEPVNGLQQQLQALLAQKGTRSSDPSFLIRLADLYLDLGDDVAQDASKRRAAYEEGARVAHQAIELEEPNAHAHYLYAANLGSGARLNGLMASAMTIHELKHHVKRALELNPLHAPALHMMGMMLEELPWVLGGDTKGALMYLQRAVAADPLYAHARLDLARAYIKRKDMGSARKELAIIFEQPLQSDASASDRLHREEARQLRESLNTP